MPPEYSGGGTISATSDSATPDTAHRRSAPRAARTESVRRAVDDEEGRAALGERAMRLRPVGDLIAHAWREMEATAVAKLRFHLPGGAEQDVSLFAPVI